MLVDDNKPWELIFDEDIDTMQDEAEPDGETTDAYVETSVLSNISDLYSTTFSSATLADSSYVVTGFKTIQDGVDTEEIRRKSSSPQKKKVTTKKTRKKSKTSQSSVSSTNQNPFETYLNSNFGPDHITSQQCSVCKTFWKNRKALKYHVRSHNKESAVCDLCNKTLTTTRGLLDHLKVMHFDGDSSQNKSEQEALLQSCDYCGKSFRKLCSLSNHVRADHLFTISSSNDRKRSFNCDLCNGYTSKERLRFGEHMERAHFNGKTYVNFYSPTTDPTVAGSVHPPDRCPFCPYVAPIHRRLNRPISIRGHLFDRHNNRLDIVCIFCFSTFESGALKDRHESQVHPNDIRCVHCGKTFDHRSATYAKHQTKCHKSYNIRPGTYAPRGPRTVKTETAEQAFKRISTAELDEKYARLLQEEADIALKDRQLPPKTEPDHSTIDFKSKPEAKHPDSQENTKNPPGHKEQENMDFPNATDAKLEEEEEEEEEESAEDINNSNNITANVKGQLITGTTSDLKNEPQEDDTLPSTSSSKEDLDFILSIHNSPSTTAMSSENILERRGSSVEADNQANLSNDDDFPTNTANDVSIPIVEEIFPPRTTTTMTPIALPIIDDKTSNNHIGNKRRRRQDENDHDDNQQPFESFKALQRQLSMMKDPLSSTTATTTSTSTKTTSRVNVKNNKKDVGKDLFENLAKFAESLNKMNDELEKSSNKKRKPMISPRQQPIAAAAASATTADDCKSPIPAGKVKNKRLRRIFKQILSTDDPTEEWKTAFQQDIIPSDSSIKMDNDLLETAETISDKNTDENSSRNISSIRHNDRSSGTTNDDEAFLFESFLDFGHIVDEEPNGDSVVGFGSRKQSSITLSSSPCSNSSLSEQSKGKRTKRKAKSFLEDLNPTEPDDSDQAPDGNDGEWKSIFD